MIRVTLINPSDRRYFLAQWDDPITGKTKSRSTKTTVRRDAERFAARLETELNADDYAPNIATTWESFKARYKSEVLQSKRHKTQLKTISTFNAIDREIDPKMLASLADPNVISKFSAKMMTGRKAPTVDGHLREIRKILIWAERMGLIKKRPHIQFPEFDDEMKGRPITLEEFERIKGKATAVRIKKPTRKRKTKTPIAPTPVILPEFVDGWIHFLDGLWLSSLRLDEAMKLHWTDDREMAVDFSYRHPMFRIQAKTEKGKTFRLLPMTPDFAAFLAQTPQAARRGYVFNPLTRPPGRKEGSHRPTPNHAGTVISELGELAGVKVNETKFASAHDFRRSFGARWCKIVPPQILQELMRHEDYKTTQKFYVGQMAEAAADEIWRAHAQRFGNTSGNSSQNDASESRSTSTENTVK